MHKETLRTHLHNSPLVQAIAQKREIDDTRKRLLEALTVIRAAGVTETAEIAVQDKYAEYGKISRNYGNMIEDTWGIVWQDEEIIRKYIDCCDDDIDELSDTIKA